MILLKKALRSMWDNKRAYIACIALIAVGITVYLCMGIGTERLAASAEVYYKNNNAADVYATVTNIPASAREKLLRIEGIDDVNLRLKQDVRVYMPDNEKVITLRLVSLDLENGSSINVVDQNGVGFSAESDVLFDSGFLEAHNLAIGDEVTVVINGKTQSLNICGTGQSPEYVYIIKNASDFLPDSEAFSVAFMPEANMAAMLGKAGQYNDIVFTLENGYTFDDVKQQLEDELKEYGLSELYKKDDQVSYMMVDEEISSNRSMVNSIPFIFVFMAIIVLYLMMKRVIEQDRMQIGTMKAFGYKNSTIIGHYLVYGVLTGLAGAIFGIILGYLLSDYVTWMLNEYYKLPTTDADVVGGFVLTGFAIGIGGGILGAYMGARAILKLSPSESMRAEAPAVGGSDILRYLPFLKLILNSGGSMALRSITRNKFRSAFVVLGMMFSFGMLAFMASYDTMFDDMLIYQFSDVQRFDIRVTFNIPTTYDEAVESVRYIDGVTLAEGYLDIPVTLSNGHKETSISITGIDEGAVLYRVYDSDEKTSYPPTTNGIVISNIAAKNLGVAVGDNLTVKSNLLDEDIKVRVARIVTQNLGSSCYMERSALTELFDLGDIVTSVGVKTNDASAFKSFVLDGDNVGVIEDAAITLVNYRAFLSSYDGLIGIIEVIAVIIAFAIIYNTSTISLSERQREYATLRVLGMQVKEVGGIMAFEYWALCGLGMILGVPFTGVLKQLLATMFTSDAFAFPTNTEPISYVAALIGCVVAVAMSNYSARKKIGSFDMVEVLKERE